MELSNGDRLAVYRYRAGEALKGFELAIRAAGLKATTVGYGNRLEFEPTDAPTREQIEQIIGALWHWYDAADVLQPEEGQ